ncbi:protease inhibitor I42 family protein [Rhodoblastus acidophilus]|uniref:Protease inhibitor I42 family protein n=1 Tax=Candidatus Rhodoblastus alkanivorans TaxID=2954117 RepID=A0ABS9ZC25_9HYPH|nr:protease inhibitor I42 family protein [Candidatus Rhodoblastus alkanivorans]MCI4679379.1 protease inhibitor I42 family protein [Candidatus Rhodoblastus alkanivorans]MCI4684855.1 protease inhibitor I42 family protein [Candidatus Rhodoblastus alkanivorans]MDI4642179.1 protease inhibitor I42 family protein [Rhodoblastus acidophilus]
MKVALAAVLVIACFCGRALAADILTEADAGVVRAVAAGETIALRLPENPSTGYVWAIEVDPPSAAAVVADYWTARSGLIGAPGTREFTLAVKRAGPFSIRVKNRRPWEGDASATQRLIFRFDAR